MGTYRITEEDGSVYEITEEDEAPAKQEPGFWAGVGDALTPSWSGIKEAFTPPFMKDAEYRAKVQMPPSDWNGDWNNIPKGSFLPPQEELNKASAQLLDNVSHPLGTQTPGGIGEMIPGTRTIESLVFDAASGDMQSPSSYLNEFGGEVGNAALGLGMYGAYKGAKAIPGAYEAGRDWLHGGRPLANVLYDARNNSEIYANQLGVGKRSALAENRIVQQIDDLEHQTFTEMNPMQGVDPNTGREGLLKFKQNLDTSFANGVKAREGILSQVSELENAKLANAGANGAPSGVGVSFADIPTKVVGKDGLSYGLDHIVDTRPGGVEGVAIASDFVKEQFGLTSGHPMDTGRPLSATELNTARKRVDAKLRELGAFDPTNLPPGVNPSALDSEIAALKFYRHQMDQALKSYIGSYVGDDVATAFTKAGNQIDVAIDYKEHANRFQADTGQAFAADSAKAVPKGSGILEQPGTVRKLRSMLPGEDTQVMEQGLRREPSALRNLNMLLDYNRGAIPAPMPRSWARIKMDALHLQDIGMFAVAMGLVQQPGELSQLPDAVAQKVVGMIAQQAPQLFEQNPDKINVIDNKFQDGMGKDIVLQDSLDKPPAERAPRIGGTFEGRYVPRNTPTPTPQPTPQASSVLDMTQLNSAFDIPEFGYTGPYDGSTDKMIDRLNEMTSLHAIDQ